VLNSAKVYDPAVPEATHVVAAAPVVNAYVEDYGEA
jgi:hypothetical protein